MRTIAISILVMLVALVGCARGGLDLSWKTSTIFALASTMLIVVLQFLVGWAQAYFDDHKRDGVICKCGHPGDDHHVVHRVQCMHCDCPALVEVIRPKENSE